MSATPRNFQRHGKHQEIHYGRFRTNKYGVLSGTIARHREEAQNEPEAKYLLPGGAPPYIIPCVGVEREFDMERQLGVYTYTYDGVIDGDTTFEDKIYCTCEGNDTEEPIETHPQFAELFKKYAGKIDRDGRFSHFGRIISLDGNKEPNPLFGVTHFLAFTMVWTRTYVRRALPASIFARVDCIDRPLGHKGMQPPSLKGKRNWLKLAPVAQQRENYITISERWMASGRNGWNRDVYTEKSGLGGQGAQSGLQSGGLQTGSL